MAERWRTQTTNLQSIVVEACWRPMVGDVAGDFYDIVDLRDGRVAIVVGDAPGFGPRAAELADDLRAELRLTFHDTDDPRAVLDRLDGRLRRAGDDLIATAACTVIDPQARQVDAANAGHLPIVVATQTDVAFLDGIVDPPLGVQVQRHLTSHPLPDDATLFLYTDGLIERRWTSLAESLDVLEQAAHGLAGASAWASELARRVTLTLGQPADDATIVSVRVLETFTSPLSMAPPRSSGPPAGTAGR
jgi:chemotaxis family two-component system sensor kinase Cph1